MKTQKLKDYLKQSLDAERKLLKDLGRDAELINHGKNFSSRFNVPYTEKEINVPDGVLERIVGELYTRQQQIKGGIVLSDRKKPNK